MSFSVQGIENLEEIHQSDYSIVYRGREAQSRQPVAVKVLKNEFPSLQHIARFNEEYEITHRSEIPGIRRILSKQKWQNRPVLIMEYIDGIPLRKLIDEQPFQMAFFLHAAVKISQVLTHIHQHRIIHKDINPKNIIVTEDGEVKLIDFGIATLIPRQVTQLAAPEVLEGTLAYISPEQTGRMNRSVDYRTDLYSLGITFYEMLTGRLPFEAKDAVEIVHAHMAKLPAPPDQLAPAVPPVLSRIVLRLLAKNAEDRYQSAAGLKADLENCLSQWQNGGTIGDFELAQHDTPDKFYIPEKLYGRDRERTLLLNAFERVCAQGLEIMRVAGYSGIGKTVMINEIHRPVTEKKGYFISGKFEQFQRDVPYSAIIHALRDFAVQLLAESQQKIQQWKERMLASLGSNGQLLIDVVPGFELIIGKQPALPELPPAERQNRFNAVFQRFIADMSRPEHPLVMFIDDWQWADSASLNFLRLLTSETDPQYLLIICAYRDNEVDQTHPLMMAFREIDKTEIPVHQIDLQPLQQVQVNELVADTLKTDPAAVASLSELIYQKTGGNPFFINQFFKSLYDNGQIIFDHASKKWQWDINRIRQLDITSNIVELMLSKIARLSKPTQQVLQLAACIGNSFPLILLAQLYGKNQKETLSDLDEALIEGLVIPLKGNYYSVEEASGDAQVYFKFLHDRVEQAAYAMVSEQVRTETHLAIGRMLVANYSQQYIEEWLFDITNYFNSAAALITDPAEKLRVAELNLKAGKKAKDATAYQSAENYFSVAIDLLGESAWTAHRDLAFELYREQGEASFMASNFEKSAHFLEVALDHAQSNAEIVQVYMIIIAQLSGQARYPEAAAKAVEALNKIGMPMPLLTEKEALQQATGEEIGLCMENIRRYSMEDLLHLPFMEDEELKLRAHILGITLDCLVIGLPEVLPLFAAKLINLTVAHGTSLFSPLAYAFFCAVLSAGFRDYKTAYEFACLALRLNEEKMQNQSIKSKVYVIYGFFSILGNPLTTGQAWQLKAFQAGLEVGDFVYSCYGMVIYLRFLIPSSLKLAAEENQKALVFYKKINYFSMVLISKMYGGFIKNLQGTTPDKKSFNYDDFDEDQYVETYTHTAPLIAGLFKKFKLQALAIFGHYEDAWYLVEERQLWISSAGAIDLVVKTDYYFYCGLVAAGLYENAPAGAQQKYMEVLDECIGEIKLLSDQCPMNFYSHYAGLCAEKARVLGNFMEAMNQYDASIQSSNENGFGLREGIVAELAAKFYLSHHKNDFARIYLAKAHYAYSIWGADAKVKALEEQYARIFDFNRQEKNASLSLGISYTQTTGNHTTRTNRLDVQSIVKASQAISREIKLEKLLHTMMSLLIENAGAEKGVILRQQSGEWWMVAQGNTQWEEQVSIEQMMLTRVEMLPASLIRYVERTGETLVIEHAVKDKRFAQDVYIREQQTKSVLCFPVLHQSKVKAIIYLENNLATHVFTPERVEILSMLCGQIATSIENAEVYGNLEQKVTERTLELSEKNQRITDSIRYAQRIQQAILPTEKEFADVFSDHFVIYKPKDIVSGDFYWLRHHPEQQETWLAVVDCTGHGVPGAFMSMIGNTLLDEIITGRKADTPAGVLELLNQMVRTGLRQDETDNTDGMDLALCKLEKTGSQTFKLTFSGARRTLYCTKNQEFIQINPSRIAIGGRSSDSSGRFVDQELLLSKGDIIYLTTDGFADQANAERRSFGTRQLRDLFQQHSTFAMQRQKQVLDEQLANHQKNTPQRDDITVVGVKI